jgi:urease accessory protein
MTPTANVFLLADGRSPTGAVTHSGGIEQAVRGGVVHDDESLSRFLVHRLRTAGVVSASLAAAACRLSDRPEELASLDAEADARMPSAATREASRAQGRGLLRLARASWPHPAYAIGGVLGERPHHAIALGVAVAAAGGACADAAVIAGLSAVSGPASAAVRLLGLDPIRVTAQLARLGPDVDAIVDEVLDGPDLPATSHPLLEIYAEHHAGRQTSLFAS